MTLCILAVYIALLVISWRIVEKRDGFTPKQKKIHCVISFVFPVWGILIHQFPARPVEGSHFYPDKKNKYSDSPEQDSYSKGV